MLKRLHWVSLRVDVMGMKRRLPRHDLHSALITSHRTYPTTYPGIHSTAAQLRDREFV